MCVLGWGNGGGGEGVGGQLGAVEQSDKELAGSFACLKVLSYLLMCRKTAG